MYEYILEVDNVNTCIKYIIFYPAHFWKPSKCAGIGTECNIQGDQLNMSAIQNRALFYMRLLNKVSASKNSPFGKRMVLGKT